MKRDNKRNRTGSRGQLTAERADQTDRNHAGSRSSTGVCENAQGRRGLKRFIMD